MRVIFFVQKANARALHTDCVHDHTRGIAFQHDTEGTRDAALGVELELVLTVRYVERKVRGFLEWTVRVDDRFRHSVDADLNGAAVRTCK